MEAEHLQELRRLLGHPPANREEMARIWRTAAFVESGDVLREKLGNRCIGSVPAKLSELLILISSLRWFGCLLLIYSDKLIDAGKAPGALWITFYCSEEKAKLIGHLAIECHCELAQVCDGIYTLTGDRAAEPLQVAHMLTQRTVSDVLDQAKLEKR